MGPPVSIVLQLFLSRHRVPNNADTMKCQIAIVLLLALSAFGAEQKSEGRDKRGALLAYSYPAAYSYPYYTAPYAYSPYYSSGYVASPYTSSAYVASPYAAYTYYK